jgi:hypothetical protein
MPHRPYTLQIAQNQGRNRFSRVVYFFKVLKFATQFCPGSRTRPPLHAKICYALQPHKASIVLRDFARSCPAGKKASR